MSAGDRILRYSPRGILLSYGQPIPDLSLGVIAVELYCKWYDLFLITSDSITPISYEVLEDYRMDESAYVDHVPNPNAVVRYAHVLGVRVCNLAHELMIGRWEMEAKYGYISRCPYISSDLL